MWTDLAKKSRNIQARGAAMLSMMSSVARRLSSLRGTHSRMRMQEMWKRNLAGALFCVGRKYEKTSPVSM